MSNTRFFNWTVPLVEGTVAKAEDVNAGFDGVNTGFDAVELELNRAIKLPSSESASEHVAPAAAARIGYVVGFDGAGALAYSAQWYADWDADGFRLRNLPDPVASDEPVTLGYLGAYSADLAGLPTIVGQSGALVTDGATVSWGASWQLVPDPSADNPSSVLTYSNGDILFLTENRNRLKDPNGILGGQWITPLEKFYPVADQVGSSWQNGTVVAQTFEHCPAAVAYADGFVAGDSATAAVTIDASYASGNIYLVLRAYNSNKSLLAESTGVQIAFGTPGINLPDSRYTETATLPASTAYVSAVLKFDAVTAAAGEIVVRDMKLEAGLDATPANDDGTLALLASSLPASPNILMNADFGIWQTGTSFSSATTNLPLCDGWARYADGGTASAYTFSRQVTGSDSKYCLRIARNAAATDVVTQWVTQILESRDSYQFVGKKSTVSFWARIGAGWAATSVTITLRLGSGDDQGIAAAAHTFSSNNGASSFAAATNISSRLTSSWQKFVFTTDDSVDSATTQVALQFALQWSAGASGANDYMEIKNVKLEPGVVATPFIADPASFSVSRAQRRYYKTFPMATTPAQNAGTSGAYMIPQVVGAATACCASLPIPRNMREVEGTTTTYNTSAANAQVRNSTVAADCSAASVSAGSFPSDVWLAFTSAAGSAAGNAQLVHYTVDRRL